MHRSGTSCLSGSLQKAGLFLGDVSRSGPFNPKGNRENPQIQKLQDDILSSNGGLWHNPPAHVAWSQEHYAELRKIIAAYSSYPVWGFKDPRTLFTLSGFKQCINNLQLTGTFRNPGAVVASLAHRHANVDPSTPVSDEYWLQLWNKYNVKLIETWEQNPFPIIDFDQDDASYLRSLQILINTLGLDQSLLSTFIQNGFLAGIRKLRSKGKREIFFDPKLRSSASWSLDEMPSEIKSTYKMLQEIAL
jgi:hypothetical protein